jgi:hypothetical protein
MLILSDLRQISGIAKGGRVRDKIYKRLPLKTQKFFSTSEGVMFINLN